MAAGAHSPLIFPSDVDNISTATTSKRLPVSKFTLEANARSYFSRYQPRSMPDCAWDRYGFEMISLREIPVAAISLRLKVVLSIATVLFWLTISPFHWNFIYWCCTKSYAAAESFILHMAWHHYHKDIYIFFSILYHLIFIYDWVIIAKLPSILKMHVRSDIYRLSITFLYAPSLLRPPITRAMHDSLWWYSRFLIIIEHMKSAAHEKAPTQSHFIYFSLVAEVCLFRYQKWASRDGSRFFDDAMPAWLLHAASHRKDDSIYWRTMSSILLIYAISILIDW